MEADAAIEQLVRAASDALARDGERAALVAAVNGELATPGRYPRRLYDDPGRMTVCTALDALLGNHGWLPIALHELRRAPRGGLTDPAPASWRPDPWNWLPKQDEAKLSCTGTHTAVWNRGNSISTPSHPDPAPGTRCGEILRGRRIPRRFEPYLALSGVIGFDHDFFLERGVPGLGVDESRELLWRFAFEAFARSAIEEVGERYEERQQWWEHRGQYYAPSLGPVYIHDPARPELTGLAVRARTPDPGFGWRTVEVGFWTSAWHQLEVRGRPWERIDDLATLGVSTWDKASCTPVRALLLDWAPVPGCPGHRLPFSDGPAVSHEWDNLWPVVVDAEVAEVDGRWTIVEARRCMAPELDGGALLDPGQSWRFQRPAVLETLHGADHRRMARCTRD